jgi:hypothetical protein
MATNFKSPRSYLEFAYSVERCRRYMRTADDDAYLAAVLATSEGRSQEVPEGTPLWRAQIGFTLHKDHDLEIPLSLERMKPPSEWLRQGRAPEGRINPKGIPFLYTSTHPKTAVGEVRPSKGALVSLAESHTSRPLRLMNCTTDEGKIRNVIYIQEPEGGERTLAVWRDIDRAFSEPVTGFDDRAHYAATQAIAELFRLSGYDGIAYRSSFGRGHNIALFDLDAAIVVGKPQLVRITGINLETSPPFQD